MPKTSLGRVSLVPKGAYNAATAYNRLDVVTHDGASYIVLRSVQGVTPADGEDYMLLVEDGSTPALSIGTVETLEAGNKAAASIGGTAEKPVLNLSIPKGDTGATPELTMGEVKTLEPGTDASASLTGTAEKPVLNLKIPRGASGGVDVANAAVGQTIIVKAVDENGKPTEWEAVDMASGGGVKDLGDFETFLEMTTENSDVSFFDFSKNDKGETLGSKNYKNVVLFSPVMTNTGVDSSGAVAELGALICINGTFFVRANTFTRAGNGLLFYVISIHDGYLEVFCHGRDSYIYLEGSSVSSVANKSSSGGYYLGGHKMCIMTFRYGVTETTIEPCPMVEKIESLTVTIDGGTSNAGIPYRVLGR